MAFDTLGVEKVDDVINKVEDSYPKEIKVKPLVVVQSGFNRTNFNKIKRARSLMRYRDGSSLDRSQFSGKTSAQLVRVSRPTSALNTRKKKYLPLKSPKCFTQQNSRINTPKKVRKPFEVFENV